jgi:L-alanine-DL-glutamate epimerase-like enolase superfamily enzyme
MPVHALMGTVRTKVPVYSSTTFNVGSPDDYAALAIETRKSGYAGYKIHPNRSWPNEHDVELEMEIYRAVRQVVSDDWPIMSDPLEVHRYPEALRVGRLLDDLGYYWYESPMPESEEHIPEDAELRKHLRLPLIGGERTVGDHEIRLQWLRSGATDWGRIDAYYGGLTSCFLVAIECEKLGVPMDIHCGTHHSLQVFGATSQQLIPFAEDFNSTYWGERLTNGELPITNEVGVGEGPDMDYVHDNRMSWEVIEEWKVASHPEN